jgi:Tfp pilus assembly protein FimT
LILCVSFLFNNSMKSKAGEKPMRCNQSGFTFHELVVIIAIMAILAAIAIPGVIGWLPKYRLGIGARDVLSALQAARQIAIKENDGVTLNFNFAGDSFTATLDSGATVRSGSMPGGIDLTDGSLGSSVRFNKLGIPSPAASGTLVVSDSQGRNRTIELFVTGTSRIQ